MKLARVIRLDDSDIEVYERPADPGEWAIPGTFEFSNWTESDLGGRAGQAFSHGWLSLTSFGRASVVAVAQVTEAEKEALTSALAQYFISAWGAPNIEAAWPIATEEIAQMEAMCGDQAENTLIVLTREVTEAGVKDRFRLIPPQNAALEAFAVHGD
jgi:hypothetical protein